MGTDNIDGARPTKRTGTFNVETTGTYVLTHSASDKSGNTIGKGKCKHTTRRTIVVKDTLKPVISLHFGGKKVHQSRANDKGVNGQANKAKFARYNPYFMEETDFRQRMGHGCHRLCCHRRRSPWLLHEEDRCRHLCPSLSGTFYMCDHLMYAPKHSSLARL